MPAPYDARKLANLLLDSFDIRTAELSNKKLNKLLYFVHGAGLARLGYPLVRNHFEAWDHGPVIDVVYHAFKQFEWAPIQSRAMAFDYAVGFEKVIDYKDINPSDRDFILRVASYYNKYSADELEEMTHEVDSPWAVVRSTPKIDRGIKDRIPEDLIRSYFVIRLGPPRSVN